MTQSLCVLWRNYPRTFGNPTEAGPPAHASGALVAMRAFEALVGLPPGDLDGGRASADRARLVQVGGPRQDHPRGGGRPVFDDALVLFPAAPGGDDEADGLPKEAHHRRQRVEPNGMALAELQRALKERFLNVLKHRGDGRLQLGEGDRLLRPVKPTDDGDLPACQVARPDLDTHRHPLQLPLIELEAGA